LRLYGPNTLTETVGRSAIAILAHQFTSLIVVLLLAAAAIAFALGEPIEAVAILAVILLNALIGLLTAWRAEGCRRARKQTVAMAHTVRRGRTAGASRRSWCLRPVVLGAGAYLADGRLIECVRLQTDEAPLTGESLPVAKSVELPSRTPSPLGDRVSMAFMGTTVTNGRGRMIVTATGTRTEVGRIAALIEEAVAPQTPLEEKLARLGGPRCHRARQRRHCPRGGCAGPPTSGTCSKSASRWPSLPCPRGCPRSPP
jgi:Ca2+-transporting ATPase